ncbi:sigma-70 family RNA polymerase sigma factor [Sporolactobacillus sp. THM7-4]|nr:sigma-70 family RNA polymerase sigma factor [Sporolactobacillus sp. THM7-4]
MSFIKLYIQKSESTEHVFERLLKQYEPLLISSVRRYASTCVPYLHGSADSDDLMQHARIAFWEANRSFDLARVDPDKTPEKVFISYTAKTINGRLSDQLRKIHRWTTHETSLRTDESFEIIDTSLENPEKELRRILDDWLFLLSPRERQYLSLSLFKEMKTKDIAEAVQVSENTVRTWKKSIRKKLQPLKESLLHTEGAN